MRLNAQARDSNMPGVVRESAAFPRCPLGTFFQCDPDLRLCGTSIYLDPGEPRETGILTHAHADHIGRHQRYIATPATAAFLRARAGEDLKGIELPFGEKLALEGGTELTFHPAGHILGSAMPLLRGNEGSLLYTGDFRLRPSLTAEPADVPRADAIIMESTYGAPEWRFPSREELAGRLDEIVRGILGRGRVPVLLAYSLGKSQEAAAMLARLGHRTVLHPVAARHARTYEHFGVDLGAWEEWSTQGALFGGKTSAKLEGKVLVIPPHCQRDLRRVPHRETVALTGWALRWPERQKADHATPLSDHADFDELLELIERASPRIVYVTHGSARFAKELRARGIAAEFLRKKPQMRLF